MRNNTELQFPHTKSVPVNKIESFNARTLEAIAAELHQQTRYMKRVDRVVSLFWAVLIGIVSLAIVAGVFWFVAASAIK